MLFPPPKPPSEPPRVVVTGAGIITALGTGWRVNAEGFRVGRAAFRAVTQFDVSRQRAKFAAEVNLPVALPPTYLPEKQVRRLDRAGKLLLLAAHEAWRQADWRPDDQLPIVLGTTSGGMNSGEKYYQTVISSPSARRGQPTRALHYQAQTQARLVAEALGAGGPVQLVANACASGANAIGCAWGLLRRGRATRVLTGGYDALSLLTFAGFDALQALSTTTCRPFDARRDGLALGEGAGVLALETLESARKRSAEILGEIAGYGAAIDLHHLTQPHPQGDAALDTMHLACASAGVTPVDVDYVNAHGTGTALNDASEALALERWAGERIITLPVSSTKASVGHLLGAAGAVEAVISLMALSGQWIPPEPVVDTPDPACRFPIVREPMERRVDVVLSNSFGFGGANASLILRRFA